MDCMDRMDGGVQGGSGMGRVWIVVLAGLLFGSAEMVGEVPDSTSRRDSSVVVADSVRPLRGAIRGMVTDGDGAGIPGATVIVDGTSRGAATNISGEFLIRGVLSGTYTLRASSIGYEERTIDSISVPTGDTVEVQFALSEADVRDQLHCPFVDYRVSPVDPQTTGTVHILTREELFD